MMGNIDYNELLRFARQKIRIIKRPVRHQFRDRYSHTLRVVKWAERINETEGGDLEVIRAASILHDIGWDDSINHAIVSRNIAAEYLDKIQYDEAKKLKVLEAIENHNMRESQAKLCIESYIVMDADILDEVGALSIIWDAMAAASDQDASYEKAYMRIVRYTSKIKQRRSLLRTKTGLMYYNERIRIIESFLKELEYELQAGGKI